MTALSRGDYVSKNRREKERRKREVDEEHRGLASQKGVRSEIINSSTMRENQIQSEQTSDIYMDIQKKKRKDYCTSILSIIVASFLNIRASIDLFISFLSTLSLTLLCQIIIFFESITISWIKYCLYRCICYAISHANSILNTAFSSLLF